MSKFLTHCFKCVGCIRRVIVETHGLNTSRSIGKTMEIRCLIVEKLCLKINHGMLMHMETIYLKHIISNATPWSCVCLRI